MEEKILKQLDRIERNSLLAAKNVLCFDDVRLLLGVSGSHLYKMTSGRKLPFYRPNGKMLYFDRKEIEEWMKQNRVKTQQEIESEAVNHIVVGKHSRKGVQNV